MVAMTSNSGAGPASSFSSSASGNRRVAVVTGGTRGIGLGIARALAREGWSLALCGVRPAETVADVLEELRSGAGAGAGTGEGAYVGAGVGVGVEVSYDIADLSRTDDRARLVESIRARYGAVHALVNNAGRAPRMRADILEATEESFEELMRTNLQGPYFLTQQIAGLMVEQKKASPDFSASIIFVTSVSADMASPNRGEYCVSKAGLAMTAKLFAVRLAEFGIPVFEIRPGIITTDMTAGVRDVYDRRIADGLIPDRRWGTPEDVGRAAAALLRGDVPYATGTVLHVDGGLTIPRL
jgi:NAD(P)-dependent dehydrogenase (short-subunit alcohol dehydrogenase family)